MKRTVKLRKLAEFYNAVTFEVNFSNVTAEFNPDTHAADHFLRAVREYDRSITSQRSTRNGLEHVRLSLG